MSNIVSDDLRSIKTEKALYGAMLYLLKKTSFKHTTVKAICEEAMISRAAFYAHFIDKYDLLKHWLNDIWNSLAIFTTPFKDIEALVESKLADATKVLKNLVDDADNETFVLFFDFLLSTSPLSCEKVASTEEYQKNVVRSNLYAGGIISYVLWLAKNQFPPEISIINSYLYDLIHSFPF